MPDYAQRGQPKTLAATILERVRPGLEAHPARREASAGGFLWQHPFTMPERISRRRMLHRTLLVAGGGGALAFAGCRRPGSAAVSVPCIAREALVFLWKLARATVESARVRTGQPRGGMGPNTTGIDLITPGGNYPAMWTRDFAMSLDSGLVPPDDILRHVRLLARSQNGQVERRLASGAVIPPFAVPDHVNLDGSPVFYPGTYSAGEDQGADPWGPLPPADDHFYFVHAAYALWQGTGSAEFLHERIGDWTLLERLQRAFDSPIADPRTGAVVATPERRAVGFGFQDSVYLLGSMAFATLLRYRAALQLAALCRAAGMDAPAARRFEGEAVKVAQHLVPVFADGDGGSGWLLAATGVGRQPDVWATLFALHLGVLPRRAARRAVETIVGALTSPGHAIELDGALRHVPANRYYRPDQCWERGGTRAGSYQSGAFWHTPTGWLAEALLSHRPDLAGTVVNRYIQHLMEHDFRKGGGHGAPWECFGPGMAGAQNPVYLTSVSLPLSVLAREWPPVTAGSLGLGGVPPCSSARLRPEWMLASSR